MKRKSTIIIAILAALFIFSLSAQSMAAEHQQGETMTMTGQIEQGMLVTDDGQTFALSGDMAEELMQMEGKRVQIMGTVMEMEEEGAQPAVEVQDYAVEE